MSTLGFMMPPSQYVTRQQRLFVFTTIPNNYLRLQRVSSSTNDVPTNDYDTCRVSFVRVFTECSATQWPSTCIVFITKHAR
ncbi:hypothetical protein ACET3X_000661 [Alternaria dauci]|uniref:Uncharacterized protein n=1 Tax=Alternaria dauci TaxID=48095 RepID=A0ABR3UVF7_9PLEO